MATEQQSQQAPAQALALTAIPTGSATMTLEPARRDRAWMKDTSAGKCLPLLMANESGWWLRNPDAFTASWNGGPALEDLTVEYDSPPRHPLVRSVFGHGIVTWEIPYLFRTPPGWSVLARGPANVVKDGAAPLEGVIETDWSPYSFTMNWKLTRQDTPVTFDRDEPVCLVVPHRRDDLETFNAGVAAREDEPELIAMHEDWRRQRHDLHVKKFLAQYVHGLEEYARAWEKRYFRGLLPDGTKVDGHKQRLRLSRFAGRSPGDPPPAP